MSNKISGLHHITAMASDAQGNLDFYAGILGLRLVKRTINFDAPDVYHLYYGDEAGTPGSIMTFFPIPGLKRGRKGNGQLTVTSFSVPENSLDYWMTRFDKYNVSYKHPQQRFDEAFIYFEDNEGLRLELVATKTDGRKGYAHGHIPDAHTIKGFYGVTLTLEGFETTAAVLTEVLNHKPIAEAGNRFRFSPSGSPGSLVDIVCHPESRRGLSGSGTVHHVAFATDNDQSQVAIREQVLAYGLNVTPVVDRQYFHSIYFREPAGVLFEVATSDIGFELDEDINQLGKGIKLPPWVEDRRSIIEEGLPQVQLNFDKYRD